MQPRQMRETLRPVRRAWCIPCWRFYTRRCLFRERDRRAAALRCGFYPVRNGRSWCSWRFALLSAGGSLADRAFMSETTAARCLEAWHAVIAALIEVGRLPDPTKGAPAAKKATPPK